MVSGKSHKGALGNYSRYNCKSVNFNPGLIVISIRLVKLSTSPFR